MMSEGMGGLRVEGGSDAWGKLRTSVKAEGLKGDAAVVETNFFIIKCFLFLLFFFFPKRNEMKH